MFSYHASKLQDNMITVESVEAARSCGKPKKMWTEGCVNNIAGKYRLYKPQILICTAYFILYFIVRTSSLVLDNFQACLTGELCL